MLTQNIANINTIKEISGFLKTRRVLTCAGYEGIQSLLIKMIDWIWQHNNGNKEISIAVKKHHVPCSSYFAEDERLIY